MRTKSLQQLGDRLASPQAQVEVLERSDLVPKGKFASVINSHGIPCLRSQSIEVLQVNVGKTCNQTCTHCHVDAGPDRKETMSRATAEQVVRLLEHASVHTLDITGGAPEMNPQFRYLVEQGSAHGKQVIDRCNLTILLAPGFTDLPEFLAAHQVEIVASLPCYLEENCDSQRGAGVFQKSIAALKQLNTLGYGRPQSGLTLTLVYNPVGACLPPNQQELEAAYRDQLESRFGIVFNRLFAITNMPISRFLDDLLRKEQYHTYMQKLINSFNPAAVESLMCRNTLSIDWRGYLYDCDFNQMLELPVSGPTRHISELDWNHFGVRDIAVGNHCFGCTAGAGSSCQGAIV